MNIQKCEKGHFYNGDRYKACPHCEEVQQANVTKPKGAECMPYRDGQSERKQSVRGYQLDDDMAETVAYRPVAAGGDTVAYKPQQEAVFPAAAPVYHPDTPPVLQQSQQLQRPQQPQQPQQPHNALPVGWLVAVSGLEYGKQYPIYTCDNSIGSGAGNSICVSGDAYVLPEHHCTLSFDIQNQKVVLNMECSTGAVSVNNVPAMESQYLSHADYLQIGGSVYMLVELCREGFSWWKMAEQKPAEQKPEEKNKVEHTRIDDIDLAFAEEKRPAARPDISKIRASMQKNANQVAFSTQKTPKYVELGSKDAVPGSPGETNVLATPYEDADAEETNILTSATWRCAMCNGLNTEYASVCRVCGAQRT